MPFKSEQQRKFLWAKHPKIAKKWAHEFPNQGKLPKKVAKESLTARAMFDREHLTEGRDDAGALPLGSAGHSYARMTSKDVMDQPGGTANKWRKSLALRKEVTNQQHVSNSKGATTFPSMDKAGKVKFGGKGLGEARQIVDRMLAD